MARLILRELARWARAVGPPIAVLVVVVGVPVLLPPEIGGRVGDRALSLGWLVVEIAAVVWLATSVARAAIQPARDRRAFERLQDLRVISGLPDHALLCILRAVWSTVAGERVNAVDVRTGAVVDLWLTESSLPTGTYVLVKSVGGTCVLVEAVPAGLVVAAQRHSSRGGACRHERTGRQRRRAAASLIRTAETLLSWGQAT